MIMSARYDWETIRKERGSNVQPFIDVPAALTFVELAIAHYTDRGCPSWFLEWLQGLRSRLEGNRRRVTVDEMMLLDELMEDDGHWAIPSYAYTVVSISLKRPQRKAEGEKEITFTVTESELAEITLALQNQLDFFGKLRLDFCLPVRKLLRKLEPDLFNEQGRSVDGL